MLRRFLISVSAIAVMGIAPFAHAQTRIDTSTTIDYAINDNVAIGLTNSQTPFTVALVPSGSIGGYLWGSGHSTVNVSGGTISDYVQADVNCNFNLYGSNLTLTNPTPYFTGVRYTLQGTLRDGHVLNTFAYRYDAAQFILHNSVVPAPGSLLTALIGVVPGVMLLRRRRKSSH